MRDREPSHGNRCRYLCVKIRCSGGSRNSLETLIRASSLDLNDKPAGETRRVFGGDFHPTIALKTDIGNLARSAPLLFQAQEPTFRISSSNDRCLPQTRFLISALSQRPTW